MDFVEIVTVIVMVCLWFLGFYAGYSIRSKKREESVGTLRIDTSDPDGPYMFLELHTDLQGVIGKKQVILDVSTQNYISQK